MDPEKSKIWKVQPYEQDLLSTLIWVFLTFRLELWCHIPDQWWYLNMHWLHGKAGVIRLCESDQIIYTTLLLTLNCCFAEEQDQNQPNLIQDAQSGETTLSPSKDTTHLLHLVANSHVLFHVMDHALARKEGQPERRKLVPSTSNSQGNCLWQWLFKSLSFFR